MMKNAFEDIYWCPQDMPLGGGKLGYLNMAPNAWFNQQGLILSAGKFPRVRGAYTFIYTHIQKHR